MRIAISGSHRTGKSTLLSELSSLLPGYATVDEPYHRLVEEGYEFSHPPAPEDFEAQLERSLEDLSEAGENTLFERCPVDFLAYLAVHEDIGGFDLDDWLVKVQDAAAALDFVVYVPIEERDRIAFSASDDEGSTREAVDAKLAELLLEDPFELGLEVVEVGGDAKSRARAVLQRVLRDSRKTSPRR